MDNLKNVKRKVSMEDQKKAYESYLNGIISFDEYNGIAMRANNDWCEEAVRRIDGASDFICTLIDFNREENILKLDQAKKVREVLTAMKNNSENKKEAELGKKLLRMFNKIMDGKYHQEKENDGTIAGKLFGESEAEKKERQKLELVLTYIIENINQLEGEEDLMTRLTKNDIYRMFDGKKKNCNTAEKLEKLLKESEKEEEESTIDKISKFFKDPFDKKKEDKPLHSIFDNLDDDDEDEDKLLDEENAKKIIAFLKEKYTKVNDKGKKFIKILVAFYGDYVKEDLSGYSRDDIKTLRKNLLDILKEVKKGDKSNKKRKGLDLSKILEEEDDKVDEDLFESLLGGNKSKKKKDTNGIDVEELSKLIGDTNKENNKTLDGLVGKISTIADKFSEVLAGFQNSQEPKEDKKERKNICFDYVKGFKFEDVGGNKKDYWKIVERMNNLFSQLKDKEDVKLRTDFGFVSKYYEGVDNFLITTPDYECNIWFHGVDDCDVFKKEDLTEYAKACNEYKNNKAKAKKNPVANAIDEAMKAVENTTAQTIDQK